MFYNSLCGVKELDEHNITLLKRKIPIVVGEQIMKARKKRKLSQTDLALLIGKDRQYLYKIEKGKVNPTIFTIACIAYVLDISLADLLIDVKIK